MINDVLADYFDEPTDEEILDGIARGFAQALRGEGRDALAFLDELDREMELLEL